MTSRFARRDRWSAVGLALLALGYLAAGRRYPLDTLATPGPGILPLAAGLALFALALWQFLGARGSTPVEPPTRAVPTTSPGNSRSGTRLLVAMSVALALYPAALPIAGFVPASAALVFVTARLMGLGGWWRPVALAFAVTVASRVLFGSWLGVPLP